MTILDIETAQKISEIWEILATNLNLTELVSGRRYIFSNNFLALENQWSWNSKTCCNYGGGILIFDLILDSILNSIVVPWGGIRHAGDSLSIALRHNFLCEHFKLIV